MICIYIDKYTLIYTHWTTYPLNAKRAWGRILWCLIQRMTLYLIRQLDSPVTLSLLVVALFPTQLKRPDRRKHASPDLTRDFGGGGLGFHPLVDFFLSALYIYTLDLYTLDLYIHSTFYELIYMIYIYIRSIYTWYVYTLINIHWYIHIEQHIP